ncbi:MAG: hypothetical protein COV72_00375 [Candidatus Omnitrophica bacterium CG11_big_fil_rev_8_21_14_0_20_42_13]|uniref:Uncharacterized protein n=1 Tax=Candidatus Ghiorseimicrobium undicola TaxID=1974746 RepID=A0A2H0M027_9BACT|nr:MAG: hypothetical protein COV72_00375 [Candidatus Omnitrophica bacterium CG11_big_fil_rev_8_21_14_0_20_42_13]
MTQHDKNGGFFSSLKYTNILLTIITLILIVSTVCIHMNKMRHCYKCKKGICPVHMPKAMPAK